jgi:hypothetical protein
MSRWERFLDGLATAGGNLFLLVLMVLLFSAALIHIMHHPNEISQAMSTTFSNILMAFVGALGNALTQKFKTQDRNISTTIDSVTTTTSTKEPEPPTVKG